MPIYEYECDKCSHGFEREQAISDPPVKTCPKCRSRKVTKLISRTSFVLKGGGWYADGYSDSKSSTSTDSDAKSDSGSTTTEAATSSGDDKKNKKKPESKPKGSKKAKQNAA